jgi:hypothetical protein
MMNLLAYPLPLREEVGVGARATASQAKYAAFGGHPPPVPP